MEGQGDDGMRGGYRGYALRMLRMRASWVRSARYHAMCGSNLLGRSMLTRWIELLERRGVLSGAGELDPTFGQLGRVYAAGSEPMDFVQTALAPDGKIIVAGDDHGVLVVVRYDA